MTTTRGEQGHPLTAHGTRLALPTITSPLGIIGSRDEAIPAVEPVVEPNYGEMILDELQAFCLRFCCLPSAAAATMMTLWIAHTHVVVEENGRLATATSPRLAFLSDVPGSGKTTACRMCVKLSHNGVMGTSLTAPTFAITMARRRPTMGIDEFDGQIKGGRGSSDLVNIVNIGYEDDGALWMRANGDEYNVYGPVVLAGLGEVIRVSRATQALKTRMLIIEMAPSNRPVETFRREHNPAAKAHNEEVANWIATVAEEIVLDYPEMPDGVNGRTAQLWEPLFAVANAAGGHWPESCRLAFESFELGKSNEPAELPLRLRLARDLRIVFMGEAKLDTATILGRLRALQGAPWAKLWPHKLSAAREMSKALGASVKPTKVRVEVNGEDKPVQGYTAASLESLWALVPDVPDVPDTANGDDEWELSDGRD